MLPPSRQPSLLRSGWSAAKKVIMIDGNDGDNGKFRQIVQCIGQVTMLLTAREHGVTAETCCAEELR